MNKSFFLKLLKINFITRFKSKLLTKKETLLKDFSVFVRIKKVSKYLDFSNHFHVFCLKIIMKDILFSNIFIANTQVGHLTGWLKLSTWQNFAIRPIVAVITKPYKLLQGLYLAEHRMHQGSHELPRLYHWLTSSFNYTTPRTVLCSVIASIVAVNANKG